MSKFSGTSMYRWGTDCQGPDHHHHVREKGNGQGEKPPGFCIILTLVLPAFRNPLDLSKVTYVSH